MSIADLCERIQAAWVSRAISESTWGYPLIGALHVLAIAIFGGAVLIPRGSHVAQVKCKNRYQHAGSRRTANAAM